MQVLNPGFDPALFFSRVRQADRRALLLDYDGTLAPFTADRDRAVPYPGVRDALAALAADGRTRLAIVSGRSVADVARLVDLPLELWGSHGLEHRSGTGAYESAPMVAEVRRTTAEISAWIRERGWESLLETKPFGLALHARGRPELFEKAGPEVLARWSGPARDAGLDIRPFDAGVEFRPSVGNKGRVVDRVILEEGSETPVAYLGDDETDEDAFAAIRGRGLGVLVRTQQRPTSADAWVQPPDGLRDFLERWSGPAGGERPA